MVDTMFAEEKADPLHDDFDQALNETMNVLESCASPTVDKEQNVDLLNDDFDQALHETMDAIANASTSALESDKQNNIPADQLGEDAIDDVLLEPWDIDEDNGVSERVAMSADNEREYKELQEIIRSKDARVGTALRCILMPNGDRTNIDEWPLYVLRILLGVTFQHDHHQRLSLATYMQGVGIRNGKEAVEIVRSYNAKSVT